MSEHDLKPAIITNNVKVLMTFIDRVGFPVLAFLLMWWQVQQLTKTIERLNLALQTQTELLRRIDARSERR